MDNLLPNYIDNLTDKQVNKYIEKHISECPNCRQKLEDMNGEFKLEKINREKEEKQLKRLNRKIFKIIIACVIATIIISILVCSGIIIYANHKNGIQVSNYTYMQVEYVKEDTKNTIDGNVYGKIIAVFDENDICVSARIVEKGYTEEYIQKRMKYNLNYTDEKALSNYIKVNNEVHYNVNMWNGINKENVLEYWSKYYIKDSIIEM